MFQGLYNKEQDAYHIQDSVDYDATVEGENGWKIICEEVDREKVAEKLDVLQNQRNLRINSK